LAQREVLIVLAGLVAGMVGCGSIRSSAKVPPTPTVFQQERRAAEFSPGFIDFCPAHNGRGPAKYDVDLPGTSQATGWCQTTVVRKRNGDYITFRAYWDARPEIGRTGTLVLTYLVPRQAAPHATPVAQLIRQSGQSPP
jgi:hypothetical protein